MIENCIGGIEQGADVLLPNWIYVIKMGAVMDKIEFKNKVTEMMEIKPILFSLDSDNKACEEIIINVEEHYNIKLPDDYKEFLKDFGGGYFGFIVVLSCDCNGKFYIKNRVSREWVLNKSFLPAVDLETGDFIGFKVESGICESNVSLYSHEEDELTDLKINFYDVLFKYGLKK